MSYTSRISAFTIVLVFVVLTLVGICMMPLLAVKLLPEHPLSSLTIYCNVQGHSPEATEQQVTTKLENAVSGLRGIKQIRSVSGPDNSRVVITLDKSADPAIFRLEASSLLRQLYPQLPPNTSYPNIIVNKTGDNSSYDGFLVYELYGSDEAQTILKYAREQLQPLLSDIKDVQDIRIAGVAPLYWELATNDTLMQQLHISIGDINGLLNGVLMQEDIGTGRQSGNVMHLVKSGNELDSFRLLQLPVKNVGGRLIRLGDIAALQVVESQQTRYQRINGHQVITLSISAAPYANILSLKKKITEVLAVHVQDRYETRLVYDATEYIQEELQSLYIRTGLSIGILLFFVWLVTRSINRLLIVVIGMAVNIFISFIGYYIFNLDIHLYSLAGITISLGLTTDNSVIVIEDIEQNESGGVFFAILASTITAVIALSVVFFLDEKQQINFVDFAIAILINLGVSLPIAFFFIPALHALLSPGNTGCVNFRKKYNTARILRIYEKAILWLIRHKKKTIIGFILLFGFPVFLVPNKIDSNSDFAYWYNRITQTDTYTEVRPVADLLLGGTLRLFVNTITSQRPQTHQNNERPHIQLEMLMPPGSGIVQMNDMVEEFEKYLAQFREISFFKSIVEDGEHASLLIYFKPDVYKQFPGYLKKLLEEQAIYAGAGDFRITGVGNVFNNVTGHTMDDYFVIKGYNYTQLFHFAEYLRDSLRRVPRVSEIFFSPFTSRDQSATFTYNLRLRDKQLLKLLNINESHLARGIDNRNERLVTVNDILHNDTYLPLKLHSHHLGVIPLWDLLQSPTSLSDTQNIRIGDFAGVEKEKVDQIIIKEDHSFVLNVLYTFTGSFEQSQLMQRDILERIRKNMPYGYSIDPGDNYGSILTTQYSRYVLLIVAFILSIYLICAILLESLLLPLVVILMIPFSFIGVFIIFYYLNMPFGDGGFASLLMLSGTVTNGALYVVNDMRYLQSGRNGIVRRKIFLKSFVRKGMPIFITTISAVLSMLPFMFDDGKKGFWYTLSVGMTGGLLFSFLGICFLLPLCLRLNKFYDEVPG